MSQSKGIGQDVRFMSNQCWIWWPTTSVTNDNDGINNDVEATIDNKIYSNIHSLAEPINGETGLKFESFTSEVHLKIENKKTAMNTHERRYLSSEASTYSFVQSFVDLLMKMLPSSIYLA